MLKSQGEKVEILYMCIIYLKIFKLLFHYILKKLNSKPSNSIRNYIHIFTKHKGVKVKGVYTLQEKNCYIV